MGKIKKILENELVGGTQSTDVYPVTSTKAVYDTDNKVLDDYIQHLKKTSTFAGIATPTTNPGIPSGPVFYIATQAGVYSNFNGIEIAKGEAAILQWKTGTWDKKVSGLVTQNKLTELEQSAGIYDVSANNGGTVFESLSALLSDTNLATLIPTSVRRGGMTIRFIQGSVSGSDNKYVQYRLMATTFSTDENDWENLSNLPYEIYNTNEIRNYSRSDCTNKGYALAGNGKLISASDYSVTDFIDVTGISSLKWTIYTVALNNIRLDFYSSNNEDSFLKNYGAAGRDAGTEYDITVPSGAKYIRFSAYLYPVKVVVDITEKGIKDKLNETIIELSEVHTQVNTNISDIVNLQENKENKYGVVANIVQSPDFSDLSKWDTTSSNFSVTEGVLSNIKAFTGILKNSLGYVASKNLYIRFDLKSDFTEKARITFSASLYFVGPNTMKTIWNEDFTAYKPYEVIARITPSTIPSGTTDIILQLSYQNMQDKTIYISKPWAAYYDDDFNIDEYYEGVKETYVVKSVNSDRLGNIPASEYQLADDTVVIRNKEFKNLLYKEKVGSYTNPNLKPYYPISIGKNVSTEVINNDLYLTSNSESNYGIIQFRPTEEILATRKDKFIVYLDAISTEDVVMSARFVVNGGEASYTASKTVNIVQGTNKTAFVLTMMSTAIGGTSLADNVEGAIALCLDFPLGSACKLHFNDVRMFRVTNDEDILNCGMEVLAEAIDGNIAACDNFANGAYSSVKSAISDKAKAVVGWSPIFKGKRMISIGDSITYQSTYQQLVANHIGAKWDVNQNCVGYYFVKVSDGSIYNLGLTYDESTGFFYDSENNAYKVSGNIETDISFTRVYGPGTYNTGLTHVNGAKYWYDGDSNAYLLAFTAKGGMRMAPSGTQLGISMYEMSFFAKLYNPDLIILTGGTNDPIGIHGTAEDKECTLSLEDCMESVNVTTCSAVKGALRRLMTDCPHAHVVLVMPPRGDYYAMNTFVSREDGDTYSEQRYTAIEQLALNYKKIADKYGVPFVDWFHDAGFNDYNMGGVWSETSEGSGRYTNKYPDPNAGCLKDGVHPNNYGGRMLAKSIIGVID